MYIIFGYANTPSRIPGIGPANRGDLASKRAAADSRDQSGRWSVFTGSRLVISTCIVGIGVRRDPTFGVYSPTATDGQNMVHLLQYRFVAIHVNGSGHTLQVQTPEDVAVDTQRRGIFDPHDCAGNEPAICCSGSIYGSGRLICTSGLTGDVTQRTSCLLTAARETSEARNIPYIVVVNRNDDKTWT